MTKSMAIELPSGFNFRTAVYSHGWCDLRPFELDEETWTLKYVFASDVSGPFTAKITDAGGELAVTGQLPDDTGRLAREIRHILRLDEDLQEFYRLTNRLKRLRWVAEIAAGRLLRSPSVWEDLVKTICTTNCSWSLTKIMVNNLVEKLGDQAPDGGRAFPTAEAMASVGPEFYRDEIRAGYRSPYFAELAEMVAEGRLDPEHWLASDLSTAELKKEMKKIKGVGDYAAENLLKLVGRYDGLALDSWLRSQFYSKHNKGEACGDKEIGLFYERFGQWKGLAIWCDMTEKWH